MNPVAIRLLNQQLVAPKFSDPAEVVGYLGAIQAQEYRLMRWAVAMRTKKPSMKAFKEAFNSGIFQPIIAHDGIICGNWSPFKEDCQVEFFEGDYGVEDVQEAWQIYIKCRQ